MKALQIIKVLNERLKAVDSSTESPEMEAMVKVVSALKKLETTEDVLHACDAKAGEVTNFADQKYDELDAAKNTNQGELLGAKNSALSAILDEQNLMQLSVAEKQNLLNAIVDNFSLLNDVPNESTICAEVLSRIKVSDFLKNESLPFIFGILSRGDDYSAGVGGYTTAFSGPASATTAHANGVLSLLIGCHNYTTEYAGFYKPPTLCFLQGATGNFIYRNLYTQHTSANSYMREAVGCIFIKNTTDAAIAATLNFGGSGEATATYGGLGAMVGVPDTEAETITWTSINYASGTNGTALNGNFSVPANTTVVLLICTTSNYIAGYETCYFKFLHWQVNQIRSTTLVDGLEIDLDLTKKAWQCPGYSNVFDFFREENE